MCTVQQRRAAEVEREQAFGVRQTEEIARGTTELHTAICADGPPARS